MSGGGSLGLGKAKSKQQSEAFNESFSEGESYGMSESVSGDSSASTSSAYGAGSSTSSSRDRLAFEQMFSQLYGGAGGAAAKSLAEAPELAEAARSLFSGGMNFMEGLGSDAGSQYMEDRLTGENPLLQQQIAELETDMGRLFTDQLNPAIQSRAVAGGTLGGGRQGVAQGMAMDTVAREYGRGVTALRVNDLNQRDTIAAQVANNSLASASTGLGALPMMLDLATESTMGELNVYDRLLGMIGGPQVLTDSDASASDFNTSSSQSAAQAFSRSFGRNAATNSSRSRGTSSSTGSSSAWNFNMSGYGGVGASGGG